MRTIIGYQLLQESDKWLDGDEYGVGFCFHIGNRAETGAAQGALVGQDNICYRPRRPIWGNQSFSVKEATLRFLRPPTWRGRWFFNLRCSLANRLHTLANRIDPL